MNDMEGKNDSWEWRWESNWGRGESDREIKRVMDREKEIMREWYRERGRESDLIEKGKEKKQNLIWIVNFLKS